ncbi:MAG: cytochrome-c peroxidase [Flavobacteriales bacterium]
MRTFSILLLGLALCGAAGLRPPDSFIPAVPSFFPAPPADNLLPVSAEGITLGQLLFNDPLLSADGSIACASCHLEDFAFSDTARYSVGIHGQRTTRNTPPLFNLVWYDALFWDGRSATIEDQVLEPVRNHREMGLPWEEAVQRIAQDDRYPALFARAFPGEPVDSLLIARAIGHYLRSILAANAPFDRALKREIVLSPEAFEGFVLANDQTKGNCLHCHPTDAHPLGTTGGFANNGLDAWTIPGELRDVGRMAATDDPRDAGTFRIPSLRNVAVTAPYMHDGRFATLEEVLQFYSEGLRDSPTRDHRMGPRGSKGVNLTMEEQRKIILFLRTLTDSSFLHNPEYAKPE